MMTEGYEMLFLIGGLFLSLSAFSLILGDNYLFRLGAAILGGAVSAYICLLLVERYFYPLILEYSGGVSGNIAMILRAAAILIGIVLLFCRAYTGSRTGGRIVMTVLISVTAVVLVLGAVGGTIPSFIKMLSGGFRIVSLSPEEKSSSFYWLKTGTIVVCAVCALLYTRHYSFGSSKEEKPSGSVIGDILIGFSFGAITATVFLTAANIFVNHVSGLIGVLQSLMK